MDIINVLGYCGVSSGNFFLLLVVRNYHNSLRNNSEERSYLLCGGNLKPQSLFIVELYKRQDCTVWAEGRVSHSRSRVVCLYRVL
jgi:hypothetical protein